MRNFLGGACLLLSLAAAAQAQGDPLNAPAEPAQRAARAMLLDVTRAGSEYVAVGMRGHVLRSADALSWTQSPAPLRTMLTRVLFLDGQHGFAFGHDATILGSEDGGASWNQRHYAPQDQKPPTLYDALFLNSQEGIAVGAFGLMLRTADAGKSWQRVDNPLSALGFHINALRRLGDGSLMLVGEQGLVGYSRDAGQTWLYAASPYAGSFYGVLPLGTNGAVLFGQRGRVYVIDDLTRLKPGDPDALDPLNSVGLDDAQAAAMGFRRVTPVSTDTLFTGIALAQGGYLLAGAEGALLRLDAQAAALQLVSRESTSTFTALLQDGERVLAASGSGIRVLPGLGK